jgi:hypothetical protein
MDEYDQSKQITFRLLYGGIDKDFEQKYLSLVKQKNIYRHYGNHLTVMGMWTTPYTASPITQIT